MEPPPSRTSSNTLPGEEEDGDVAAETHFAPINTHNSALGRIRRSLSLSRPRTNDSSASGSANRLSRKETRDPNLDIDLPYRTLSAEANLDEYRVEVPEGHVPGPVEPEDVARRSGSKPGEEPRRYKLVAFTPNDPENPKNWSKAYKWWCTMVVALTCFVVAFASSVITADVMGVAKEFGVSEEAALVPISVFVVGFGVGPMIFAPLSEIYGRRII